MKNNNMLLKLQPINNYEAANTRNKIGISEVFSERSGSYINEYKLYLAHFHFIPNVITELEIDCKKASKWFAEKYKSEIKDMHYNKRYFNGSKKAEIDDIFFVFEQDVIVNFDTNCNEVRIMFKKTDLQKIDEITQGIHKFKRKKYREKPEICLLVQGHRGIDTKELEITRPKLSIEDNYNDDFKEIHEAIFKRLSKNNDKGLVLLHGKPGTGKTSYIRYLIASVKKNVIFLPPNMAGAITNPNLISVLIDNPNSIFVIEDAENIVVDREQDGRSPVSALLNISDGLLADCLNVQIVCSFNTDISKIDNALMRKGRLIAKYEFKELQTEKAQLLSNKLGFKTQITQPMTLTSIYNQEEKDFEHSSKIKPIGFQAIGLSKSAEQ